MGRPIKQVLLLHISRLGAVMSERLLTAYEGLGARFVSLDEALTDSVYADEPGAPEVQSGNLLTQLSAAQRVEIPQSPGSDAATLERICR